MFSLLLTGLNFKFPFDLVYVHTYSCYFVIFVLWGPLLLDAWKMLCHCVTFCAFHLSFVILWLLFRHLVYCVVCVWMAHLKATNLNDNLKKIHNDSCLLEADIVRNSEKNVFLAKTKNIDKI